MPSFDPIAAIPISSLPAAGNNIFDDNITFIENSNLLLSPENIILLDQSFDITNGLLLNILVDFETNIIFNINSNLALSPENLILLDQNFSITNGFLINAGLDFQDNVTFSNNNFYNINFSIDFESIINFSNNNIFNIESIITFEINIIFTSNNNIIFSLISTLIIADRIKEFTSTIGTGNIIVIGVQPGGYKSFNSVLFVNEQFPYCIQNTIANEFEVGIGTLINSTTFSRNLIFSSSNSNNIVNFSSGTKDVFIDMPAHILANTSEYDLIAR